MRSDNTGRYIAEYVWEGGRLIREINPDRTITFLYDGDEIAGFSAGGSNYYYAKDSFGVISYVYNEDGSLYASYKYDAWGSLITSASTLPASGDINPIRYKSYYYDADTGFYYLQSRYYDPFVGRFLNADDAAYLGISGTVLGWNMFAYCENDAVLHDDYGGFLVVSVTMSVGAAVYIGISLFISFLFDSKNNVGLLIGFSILHGFLDKGGSIAISILRRYTTIKQYLEKVSNVCTIGYAVGISAIYTPSLYRNHDEPKYTGFQISVGTTGFCMEAPLNTNECLYFQLSNSDVKRMGINSCSAASILRLLRKVRVRRLK